MRRALWITTVCLIFAAGTAFGQRGPALSFNDNNGKPSSGTYGANDTFSIDVSVKYRGFNAIGLSFWLEVSNALAPNISITNVTYFTFLDPNQNGNVPVPFNSTVGARVGYMTETRDLGATGNSLRQGTYLVASIQFTLSGAAPGTYSLASTTVSPHTSQVTTSDFTSVNLTAASYKLTVSPSSTMAPVPEPTTVSLLLLPALGLGVAAYRRRRNTR